MLLFIILLFPIFFIFAIVGCVKKYLLNGRRMVLSEREDLDTWLDFATLCRNGGNTALAERVLSMSQRFETGFGLSSASSLDTLDDNSGSMDRRIRLAILKQQWAVRDKKDALEGLEALIYSDTSSWGSLEAPILNSPGGFGMGFGPGSNFGSGPIPSFGLGPPSTPIGIGPGNTFRNPTGGPITPMSAGATGFGGMSTNFTGNPGMGGGRDTFFGTAGAGGAEPSFNFSGMPSFSSPAPLTPGAGSGGYGFLTAGGFGGPPPPGQRTPLMSPRGPHGFVKITDSALHLDCLLTLGEWKTAIIEPGQPIDPTTRR